MGFIPVVPLSNPISDQLADYLGIPEQYREGGILLSDDGIPEQYREGGILLSDEGEGGEVTVGEPVFSNAAEEQTGPDQQQVYF